MKAYFNGPMFNEVVNLAGKTAVVTGGNTGIGFETVRGLANMGANVVLACRDLGRASSAIENIERNSKLKNYNLEGIKLDLEDLKSVEEFVEKFSKKHDKLDILINNAGVMRTPKWKTKQNIEYQFGVNHIGHFYLTNLLVPSLKASDGNARVVNVSSLAHERTKSLGLDDINWEKTEYQSGEAYGRSKLANVLFTNEFNRRTNKYGIYSNSLHPGKKIKFLSLSLFLIFVF